MCIIYKINIVLLLSISVAIAETSYFFSNKESEAILNQNSSKKEKSGEETKKITYKLSGILFVSPRNWTVWINDKPYSSLGYYGEFSINSVSSNSVKLTLLNGRSVTLQLSL